MREEDLSMPDRTSRLNFSTSLPPKSRAGAYNASSLNQNVTPLPLRPVFLIRYT